ncbi:MAG: M56 family metallopeptidase [Gracilimonas sp.]|uniref:M56 family metallopeptidase n=1 Tax=Gracilimonas TaxID=649462 RepID=UPI001B2E122B|nr:M56 family metallopeptidase [Gracilimonas sp.]MBO6585406.1 M56 family metallopeptidase [Gracilimonas sp.]MBO6616402.1 M56 family metallopeptidase [Gracilimonas sp.]
MYELTELIKVIGNVSLDTFWFPIMIWTICCALAFLFLKTREKLNPLFHYHLRTAAILSLPLGIAVAAIMSKVPEWFASSNLETAFFVVQNPIEIVPGANPSSAELSAIQWQEPSFFIGAATIIICLISIFMIGRLISSYAALKSLYKNLSITELQEIPHEIDRPNNKPVKLAFHDHPLVPFTFGWKQPVIVLPKILQHEPEKLDMALQHELIHIKRGDYLLQLALSMIESLFWFHPLIRYGNQEIDTYREISCDQEVLSKSDFSIKSYANLLYELVPLSTGVGKLSVSMAVKNSTLKKRIKTMKYHKLHKASFRQSIFFLFLMILGITLPIACSDLRGPEMASLEELENAKININDATLSINGVSLDYRNLRDISVGGLGAISIVASEYGAFKIAPQNFDGGIQAGKIEGNTLSFKISELSVVLNSSAEILKGISNAPIWVSHNSKISEQFKKYPPLFWTSENVNAKIPPPPPSVPTAGDQEDLGDYFVVVEEMPKLKGGMAALMSKVEYPEMARKAGIEGRVTVQFIVNEQGNVENAKVVRGIGGGCDEQALEVIKQARFTPGYQKDRPVRVQYALSINFKLEDSEFSTPPPPPVKKSEAERNEG